MDKRKLTHVRWDITPRCNLNCKHCYAANLYKDDFTELSLKQVKTVINNLEDPGVETIAFYGGEPLLRDDLKEIMITFML